MVIVSSITVRMLLDITATGLQGFRIASKLLVAFVAVMHIFHAGKEYAPVLCTGVSEEEPRAL